MTVAEDPERVDIDRLVRVHNKMAAKLKEITAAFDTEERSLKAQMALVATTIKDYLRDNNLTTVGTVHGNVSLKTTRRYYAQDWEAMHAYLRENDLLSLLERRIAQRNMQAYLDQNPGVVPPGLNSMSELEVVVKPIKGNAK